jgi:hypothetical protein
MTCGHPFDFEGLRKYRLHVTLNLVLVLLFFYEGVLWLHSC